MFTPIKIDSHPELSRKARRQLLQRTLDELRAIELPSFNGPNKDVWFMFYRLGDLNAQIILIEYHSDDSFVVYAPIGDSVSLPDTLQRLRQIAG